MYVEAQPNTTLGLVYLLNESHFHSHVSKLHNETHNIPMYFNPCFHMKSVNPIPQSVQSSGIFA